MVIVTKERIAARHGRNSLCFTMGLPFPGQNCLFPLESTAERACPSAQPFLHGLTIVTDRQTDRARYLVCSNRRHLRTAMPPNNTDTSINDNVYGAVIMARPLREFPPVLLMMQTQCQMTAKPTIKPSQPTWLAVSSPVGCSRPYPSSPFIIIW